MRQWHDWYAPCRWSQAIFGALIPMRSTHDGVSQQCNISLRARMPRAKFVAIKTSPAFSFEQLPLPGMCHYYLRSTGRWNWKFSASSPSWGIAQCEVKVSAYIQVDLDDAFKSLLTMTFTNEARQNMTSSVTSTYNSSLLFSICYSDPSLYLYFKKIGVHWNCVF